MQTWLLVFSVLCLMRSSWFPIHEFPGVILCRSINNNFFEWLSLLFFAQPSFQRAGSARLLLILTDLLERCLLKPWPRVRLPEIDVLQDILYLLSLKTESHPSLKYLSYLWSPKKGYTCPREHAKSNIEDLETKIRLFIFITFSDKRKKKNNGYIPISNT